MNIAIAIPTLNAARQGLWQSVLDAVNRQTVPLQKKLIIDSDSDDATAEIAMAYGWECRTIKRREFNHGTTRDKIVRELAQAGIDTVVFLSQDVVLARPDSLEKLTGFLWQHPIAGCFGMQRARQERTLNAWQRERCYPAKSAIKTPQDIPERGIMAAFFSNAFAAWKTAEVIRYGGFPKTDFGEDTLLAANVLRQGGAIGYCAEAVANHEHSNRPWQLFCRGMQVGKFHRNHPELLRQFGRKILRTDVPIPGRIVLPLAIKVMGYWWGRSGKRAIPWSLFGLMWILLLPAIILYDFPLRDVALRYAPMAEAFAQGEWQFAFHPRVTPLLPVSAGVMAWLFSCSGYIACQIASALLLTIGVFPLYWGCQKRYGDTTAAVAGLLYALCPPLLRLGYYGLRETGGTLGIVCLFYSVVVLYETPRKLQGFLRFALAEGILLLSRGDVALFVLAVWTTVLVWDAWVNRIAWRSFLAAGAILILLTPQLFLNYRAVGYPVPEVRYAVIFKRVAERLPLLKFLENPHPAMPLDMVGR